MKIIRPLGRTLKDDSSNASKRRVDKRDASVDMVPIEDSTKVSELGPKSWNARSKRSRGRSSEKRSKFSNNDFQRSYGNTPPEEEFAFDTSKLEAMPKDEVFEAPVEGKKRRRSELLAERACETLPLITDPAKKEFNELFARGVRLLAMREHSVKEITNKLFDKSENSTAIQAVIDELLEKKYLSDERFTESYIRSRANRGFGPVKIRAELKSRGVSNILIQDHLNEGAVIWFDSAQAQYEKKYGDAPVSDYSAWSKRARFMQSRGFTMEQIQLAVPQFSPD